MGYITIFELKKASSGGYMMLPDRVKKQYKNKIVFDKDIYGSQIRLKAIKSVLKDKSLGHMIDLGGHSGYFSLSLVDLGLAESSVIYDVHKQALEFGKKIANSLEIDDKVIYEEKNISLDYVRTIKPVDTIICLNLIHHAGTLFDKMTVNSMGGWEQYASEWLKIMKKKSKTLILGLGYKDKFPTMNVASKDRHERFIQIINDSGWDITYTANVHAINKYGIAKAYYYNNNKINSTSINIKSTLTSFINKYYKKAIKKTFKKSAKDLFQSDLAHLYYLYILENDF